MRACVFLAVFGSGLVHGATFNGTVFEDTNYGGGAGRDRTASGGAVLANARVELYRVSDGAFIQATTTSATGAYSLTSGATNASMRVRVVNGSVRSSRAGGAACTTCVPVQTFRTDASSGAPVNVTDRVGGEVPGTSDAVVNPGVSNYSTLTAGTRVPQSITTATPGAANSTINGIDFGFNFDTVVNTRDLAVCTPANSSYPCQGGLRQFIINSNALGGEGALLQSGNGQIDGATSFLPSGAESSIFMIPNGVANPGQSTTFANQLPTGVAIVTLSAALTTISGASTRLDATTQTANVGNTNAGTLGTGGTVGVDSIALPLFPRPEVQLTAGNTVVTLSGTSSAVLGLALQQGYLLLSGTGCLARNNLVGMTATGGSSANSPTTYGIEFAGTNATVRNNFVTVNNSGIRAQNGGTGSLVTLNEVARPTSGHTNTFDAVDGELIPAWRQSVRVIAAPRSRILMCRASSISRPTSSAMVTAPVTAVASEAGIMNAVWPIRMPPASQTRCRSLQSVAALQRSTAHADPSATRAAAASGIASGTPSPNTASGPRPGGRSSPRNTTVTIPVTTPTTAGLGADAAGAGPGTSRRGTMCSASQASTAMATTNPAVHPHGVWYPGSSVAEISVRSPSTPTTARTPTPTSPPVRR